MNLDSRVFFDSQISMNPIVDKKIAIIGYGNQGRAQACNLQDSNINVLIGLRTNSPSREKVKKDGLKYTDIDTAISSSDILALMIPDNQIDNFIINYYQHS